MVGRQPSRVPLGRLIGRERLRILQLLHRRPRTTNDLAVELTVTPSAVHQYLQLLRRTAPAGSATSTRCDAQDVRNVPGVQL
jgi:predicted ArsR family transcriptional regulator